MIELISAYHGFTIPTAEIIDDLHRRGWTLTGVKVDKSDKRYVAEAKNPHGDKREAYGSTENAAVGALLIKVMRTEAIRQNARRQAAWDPQPLVKQWSAVAQAYASANIYDPKAATAWMELASDCASRAATIKAQIDVEYTPDPAPYETINDLIEDVTKKRHVFITQAAAHHPVWSMQQMLDYRTVVTVLGHAVAGGDWGYHGTCLAFAQLAPNLSETAQSALYTELVGQSAYSSFYGAWGPQKIVFLKDQIEKVQEQENGPGHHGVHPSQSIVPVALPKVFGSAPPSIDPNADWESGIDPLPDNAYMWQRGPDGQDPLDADTRMERARALDPRLTQLHPDMAKQAVVNAARAAVLGDRVSRGTKAQHYQALQGIPAGVDDPEVFRQVLDQTRSEIPAYWAEEQQFRQWVKALNPNLSDEQVAGEAKRELGHMLVEEEQRVLSEDVGHKLTAEDIALKTQQAVQRRLKALTRSNTNEETDVPRMARTAASPYLSTSLRSLALLGRHADELHQAAQEDLHQHKGHGHHFRSTALQFDIPGFGPRQISEAWHHLAPQTSQLAVVSPEVTQVLGHEFDGDNRRDFFKHERQLASARDAAGYGHMPLGLFSTAVHDLATGGPGYHADRTAFKPHLPRPASEVDWTNEPEGVNWQEPYWWASTQEPRDRTGADFDRNVAVATPTSQIPYRLAAVGTAAPWVTHPQTGEHISGAPGQSLMSHIKSTFGHPSCQDVWNQDYEAGKGSPSVPVTSGWEWSEPDTVAKVATYDDWVTSA